MIVVTTETIPGQSIFSVIGEVMGVTARPFNPYTEGLKQLDGRSVTAAPSLLRWRRDAITQMIDEAKRLGADAIIGMKFDNRQITSSWSEICAYGTAVRLSERIWPRRPEVAQHAPRHLMRGRSREPG